MTSDIGDLKATLVQRRQFEECLLSSVRFTDFGYSVELTFNYIWDSEGQVRSAVLDEPEYVTIKLIGVLSFRLNGGLTHAMKNVPDRIDWGLTEVSGVKCGKSQDGLALSVEWESDRRIDAEFLAFEVTAKVGK